MSCSGLSQPVLEGESRGEVWRVFSQRRNGRSGVAKGDQPDFVALTNGLGPFCF